MRNLLLILSLSLSFPLGAAAQESLGLPTQGERDAANVASYATLTANVVISLADCHHGGEWDKKCLLRLGVKNAAALGVSEATKRIFHTTRPCEPTRCGKDHGTGSTLSGHTLVSFVNVDPFGQTHFGFSVEYSVAVGTGALRVMSLRHELFRDVIPSALAAQGINALVRFIR